MKKIIAISLIAVSVAVVAILAWRIGYSMRKSNDNLPSLSTISEMDEADVNSLLMGYRIIQLREVWGEPTHSKDKEDIWQIGDVLLIVNYKNDGKVAICDLKDGSDNSIDLETSDAMDKIISDKEWSEQEILSLFHTKAESNWNVIDCVRVSDVAFERIGVILFVDNDNGHTLLAFMDANGYYSMVGIDAQISFPTKLEYRGNGIVTLQLKTKDNLEYEGKITYSQSEDRLETNFILEDNLEDILSNK